VKDSLLNLLVFLLIFVVAASLSLVAYELSLILVPGGKGLIFASPFAASLIPGLLFGLVGAQYRSVRRPGNFVFTWAFLAAAFLLLLTLSIPVIQQMPPVRASDESPLIPGRFVLLEDGSLLLSVPPAEGDRASSPTVLVPNDNTWMSVSTETQYDPLNQRFVFSSGNPKGLGSLGPERRYFQYTPAIIQFQTDLLAIYIALRDNAVRDPLIFWSLAWGVTWLFLGLYFFFSWKTWPLVQLVLVLIMARMGVVFLVYALWSLPALIDLWLPGVAWVRVWSPLVLIDVAAATLFFMTVLTKPHRQAALV
jgi:hypothetical protein